MEYIEFRAKTVDDAITKACLKYGVTSDRLEYQVIDEGKTGFFGLGSREAVIKAGIRKAVGDAAKAKAQKKANKEGRIKKDISKESVSKESVSKESVSNAPVSNASAGAAESMAVKETNKTTGGIITSDEIEKRAAAAAARADSGEADQVNSQGSEGRSKKSDRRDRRGGRNRGRDNKRGRKEYSSDHESKDTSRKASAPRPERVIVPKTEEEIAEMEEKARTFLQSIFDCMNINVDIKMEYDQKEGCLSCIFSGDEMGILIGKRGQTLDSLQYLTSLVINKKKNDYTRVKLDTEDYRARRADTLENLSRNIAYKVKRTGKPVELEPMNPYERRIIHSSLQGNRYVETYSEGEEPYRHVVVAPKRQ